MRLLCLRCREITGASEGHSLNACPACGNTNPPADADDTVTITLTTHELRILTIWASNWAEAHTDKPEGQDSPRVIAGILDGIGQYTSAPLSLRQEVADVRAAFPDSEVTLYRDGEETDI